VAPFVALIRVLTPAPKTTSARTSRTRSSVTRKPTRLSSVAPTTASSVLPTAIATASNGSAPLVAFAMQAPTATAGHNPRPKSRRLARAIPLGAHTGVITPCATERPMPNFAEAT
jgi:hypothetical protein